MVYECHAPGSLSCWCTGLESLAKVNSKKKMCRECKKLKCRMALPDLCHKCENARILNMRDDSLLHRQLFKYGKGRSLLRYWKIICENEDRIRTLQLEGKEFH